MARPATAGEKRVRKRRIIERPRLIALLDGSNTRVKALIAAAGYGKTTLAEQWVGRDGRRATWYTASPASVDVAGLALGIARAAAAIVPDCDERLREHLRALPAAGDDVDTLAELLGEELAAWPSEAWFVLDDYHELARNPLAERLVEQLLESAPMRLVVASRQRPSWITARSKLYGDAFEVDQAALAMDDAEASDVLSGVDSSSCSSLQALAHGWPAAIGLAGVSDAELVDVPVVRESLYEFFAEEVFQTLPAYTQAGLEVLVLSPKLDRVLAQRLLGAVGIDRSCQPALDVGILEERGVEFQLHPLARSFLEDRLDRLGIMADHEAIRTCLDYFREQGDWDSGFDLIVRHGLNSELEEFLDGALDDLLDDARLSTVERWCEHADATTVGGPVVALGRAEVALRRGELAAAQALGELVAATSASHRFRALLIAGRAAHLASREEEALKLFMRAARAAPSHDQRREASWGQVMCLIDLEDPRAPSELARLKKKVGRDNARETLQAANLLMYCQTRFGGLDLSEAERAAKLLPYVPDPLVRSSFLSSYCYALVLQARYPEAEQAARSLEAMARQYRFTFAMPFAWCARGLAEAGMRKWSDAVKTLTRGVAEAREHGDLHGEAHCVAALARTHTQQGRGELALALLDRYAALGSDPGSIQMQADFQATAALALATADRLEEAEVAVHATRGLSGAVESTILIAAVEAIAALKRHDADAVERVQALVDRAFSYGGLDLVVTAYRATPELLAVLLRVPSRGSEVRQLVHRVGDEDVAGIVDPGFGNPSDPTAVLTARQLEVHDLVAQSLSNREIAQLLYISEKTVKLHVHHIFDRLGVRSRKSIAMRALLKRSAHATSAIDETETDSTEGASEL